MVVGHNLTQEKRKAQSEPRLQRESGAAMVEFALVLPVLLLLIIGMIDFGFYFYNDLQLSHAVRDAARQASVAKTGDYDDATEIIRNVRLFPPENTTLDTVTSKVTAGERDGVPTVVAKGEGEYRFMTPFLPLTRRLYAEAEMRHE